MGFIRSSIVVFLSSILFLSLFLGNLFLTLSWSLEYDAVQPHLQDLTNDLIQKSGATELINQNYDSMKLYCTQYDSFNFSQEGFNLEIPCTTINEGPQAILDYGTKEIIQQIYFKDYNCEFWECIKEQDTPYVLISQKAQSYWNYNFHLAILLSAVLFFLLFVFTKKKRSSITITGILLIIAALPFRKIDWLLSLIPPGELTQLIGLFFTKANNVFTTMILIGAIVLLVGLAFEFFGAGMKITKFFKKAKEEDEKEELEEWKKKKEEEKAKGINEEKEEREEIQKENKEEKEKSEEKEPEEENKQKEEESQPKNKAKKSKKEKTSKKK